MLWESNALRAMLSEHTCSGEDLEKQTGTDPRKGVAIFEMGKELQDLM